MRPTAWYLNIYSMQHDSSNIYGTMKARQVCFNSASFELIVDNFTSWSITNRLSDNDEFQNKHIPI